MTAFGGIALKRLGGMLVVMFFVATVVFAISHVIPGDPAAVMLGPSATAADVAALRTRLGLDAPLPLQYLRFLADAVSLDLGQSLFLGQSVASALLSRAPVTLQLTALAALFATGIGVPVGVFSAVRRGGLLDQCVTGLAMTAASLPSFWIGLTLIEYLSVRLRLFPVPGMAIRAPGGPRICTAWCCPPSRWGCRTWR
ncbi:MAG: ABC transporter permease [Acetobacteraceae bacterium]